MKLVLAAAAAFGAASSVPATSTANSPVFSCSSAASPQALTVFADGSYEVMVNGSTVGAQWFVNGSVAVFVNQVWYTSSSGLSLGSGYSNEGNDALGAFTSWTYPWQTATFVPLTTTFKCYATTGYISFDLAFPDGAEGMNMSTVNADSVVGPCDPTTRFPSFAAPGGSAIADDLLWMHHSGIWTLNEDWGQGLGNNFGGCQKGPLYLLDPMFSPGKGAPAGSSSKPTTVIVAASNHFHASSMSVLPDPLTGQRTFTVGLASTILSVPSGYTLSVGFYATSQGYTTGVGAWGQLMQQLYATSRIVNPARDALTRKLSYWSDNGAVYFQGWWDEYCPSRNCSQAAAGVMNPEQTFIALKEYHTSQNVPASIYQLDTWWFYQGADEEPKDGNIDCAEWAPRADMWPHGLPYVTQQAGGVPLLLYSWGFVTPQDGNKMDNFTWETSLAFQGAGNPREGQPELDQVYAFYSMIRDRFLSFNGTSMEEDNIGTHTMQYASHLTTADGVERWWQGFAQPWCESAIPLQVCESQPADVLESLKYGCVTNSRDNIDNVPGQWDPNQGGNNGYFARRWHVGFDRPMLTALAVMPFYDNVWTMPTQPSSSWNAPTDTEEYLELAWILTTLSAGPVGFSDVINNTNATLVSTCCMADGTILKASTTSSYLDLVYLPPAVNPIDRNTGRLFQAHAYVGSTSNPYMLPQTATAFVPTSGPSANPVIFASLLAVDVAATLPIYPSYFSPDLSGLDYVWIPWSRGIAGNVAACCPGCAASACVQLFNATQPIVVSTGVASVPWHHNFEYYALSPVLSGGWALLGELSKVVRVSPLRFNTVSASPASLSFKVASNGGETVHVSVVCPSGTAAGAPSIATVDIPFSPGAGPSSASVVCSAGSTASAPCSCATT